MSKHSNTSLADFTRDKRIFITSLLSVVIGISSALVAAALVQLIAFFTNVFFFGAFTLRSSDVQSNHLGLFVVVVPIVGGLIVGLMARYGSEKIRGHGIPEALEAILIGKSKMDAKVAVLKPLSSAISIGTGGPFGAEGPIIMTGGAFASLFAQLFSLSAPERKTLLVAGASAGMAAIFCTPVAAVVLAVELLLFELKPRSVIPVAIASSIGASLRTAFLGQGPLFPVPPHAVPTNEILILAAVTGIAAGLCSGLLTNMVYFTEDAFPKLKMHWMWWPPIGGAFVGLGALVNPKILGAGYPVIHELLQGNITGGAAINLCLDKALVWAISLGSGTSGGVLAPLLIIGGGLGAIEAACLPVGDPGLWAMLGMAAMMGGTMRSPLTSTIFILELTHDLNLLPALLITSIAAHGTTVMLLKRSILTEKVARRGRHISREYSVDPLEMVAVEQVMDRNVTTVNHNMPVAELAEKIARNEPQFSRRHALPIVNEKNELVGIITRSDIFRAMESNKEVNVLEAGQHEVLVTYPDEMLRFAVDLMLEHDIGRLPVVERENPTKLLGMLGRSSVMLARRHLNELESHRESMLFVRGN